MNSMTSSRTRTALNPLTLMAGMAGIGMAGFISATVLAQSNSLAQSNPLAQNKDDAGAITARVHGTFQDNAGGLGVLSGDMTIVRFEVRNGTVTAVGQIVGALADSAGNPLGRVNQPLELPIGNVASSCNQIRMDLASADADVLQTPIHFDKEVAGFDSREGNGMVPKALAVLCAAKDLLQGKPTPDALAQALNNVATAAASAQDR
jgi:hypothetical protein